MPTVSIDAEYLKKAIKKPNLTEKEFDELCFDFGIGK
jgi:hypothetical protein